MPGILSFLILALAPLIGEPSSTQARYELVGKILQENGKPFPARNQVVFLHGATTPFYAQTLAGRDGGFKFKKLAPGAYLLTAAVPRVGEMSKTVEVGPSFADSKRVIVTKMSFGKSDIIEKNQSISTVELSVPQGARREFTMAQDRLSRQDVEGAIQHLKKAVEMAPQFVAAWNNLGTIAYQSDQFDQAEEYFREALKQDPDAYYPLVNLGGTLLSLERYEESLPINARAVKEKPGDPLAQSQLGQSYFFLGQLDVAESHLKKAKSLDPSHFSHPQLVLMKIYASKNQVSEAIMEMEEFLRLHPDSHTASQIRELMEKAAATPK
jgi:tetratricopeptide (TPR) repeat protein